ISQGLRELGVESTLLVFNERPFKRGFDVNLQLRDTSRKSSIPSNLPKQLRAFVWAVPRFDVFHFHAGLTLLPRKLNLPALRALRKGIVFQSWGSDLRGRPASDVRYLRAAGAVIVGSYLTRRLAPSGRWPEYDVVPPAIVLQDWQPAPTEPGETLRLAHAPSKRAVKGPDAVPDVVIDQLRIGWYGMLAIESMALAKPVVVHLDEQAAGETEEAFGLELPLVRANEQSLEDVLAGLVEVRKSLPELGRRSREYVEHVHAHTKVARQVLDIYERVMPINS